MTRWLLLCGMALAAPAAAQNTFHGNMARTGVYEAPGPTACLLYTSDAADE